jgi:dienelactone hydrolase
MKEGFSKTVHLRSEGDILTADWIMPPDALGIVLFAHGSGSSRHSSRNKAVARYLVGRGMGTLLLDLLTPEEERIDNVTRQLRFDIPLLAKRLVIATHWLSSQGEAKGLPLGYFGASTGAAAALIAAGELGEVVAAVVSRGGRPDLAGNSLPLVTSPTLLLVGGEDDIVEELNRKALAHLHGIKEIVIIPGATHLFEEPGMLDQVAVRAADWFAHYFAQDRETHRKIHPVTELEMEGVER